MSHILIIGAGGVGSVVVHKCAQVLKEGGFSKVTLASRTLSRCDAIAQSVKTRLGVEVATAQVDARRGVQRGPALSGSAHYGRLP